MKHEAAFKLAMKLAALQAKLREVEVERDMCIEHSYDLEQLAQRWKGRAEQLRDSYPTR